MNPQNAINILAKVIPLLMDVLAVFPIISIPTTTIKIVEDGIALETSIVAFLTTTSEGKALWAKVQAFGNDLGVGFHLSGNTVVAADADTTAANYDWDPLWGWVPKTGHA